MEIKQKQKNGGVIFFTAIISCFIAFVNKYPLVYPDTGTYIYSGFNNISFDDRPIFYGLFLRHISLSASLWFVIFAQAWLVSWLLHLTLGMFFNCAKRNYLLLISVTALTLFTGFSYTVSILVPDIFSSLSLLCLINLVLNTELGQIRKIALSGLFIFSVCTQYSSIAILFLVFVFFAGYFLVKKIRRKNAAVRWRSFVLPFCLYISCLLIIPCSNFINSKQFKFSGSSHVFIMYHFIETGVLQDYLKNNCENSSFRLCEYKDQLGWDFIWAKDSPLHKTGGWKANEKIYNWMIRDILTTPKYFVLLSHKSIEYTLKQFFTFNAVIPPPQLSASAFDQIKWRYRDTLHEYFSALQSCSAFKWDLANSTQPVLVLFSLIFLFIALFNGLTSLSLNTELRWTVLIILIYMFFSCFICSNLSTIDARFQGRIIWLLPFFAFVLVVKNKRQIIDFIKSQV